MHSPIFYGSFSENELNNKEYIQRFKDEDYLTDSIQSADYAVVDGGINRWCLDDSGLLGEREISNGITRLSISRTILKKIQEDYISDVKKYLELLTEVNKNDEFNLGKYSTVDYRKYTHYMGSFDNIRENFYDYGGTILFIDGQFYSIQDILGDASRFYNSSEDVNDVYTLYFLNELVGDYHF